MSAGASATAGLFILLRREGEASGINRIYRLYREEGLTVRKRRARRRAVGTRAPILVEARPDLDAAGGRDLSFRQPRQFRKQTATRTGRPAERGGAVLPLPGLQ